MQQFTPLLTKILELSKGMNGTLVMIFKKLNSKTLSERVIVTYMRIKLKITVSVHPTWNE